MKRSTLVILAILLVAFGLRVWNLSAQSVWWDEAFTVQTTSHGWSNLWHMLQTGDRNPPLYFLSLYVWGGLAGWGEFSLRFLSLVYGVVGLALLVNLGNRLFGSRAGVWAMAVAALSPALVVYSQEGRMYALFLMLSAATLYFGMRNVEHGINSAEFTFRSPRFALFILFESALLLTHYFAIPIVVALNVLALVGLLRYRARLHAYVTWLGGQLLAALPLFAWLIFIASSPGSLTLADEPRPNLIEFARQTLGLSLTGMRDQGNQLAWLYPGAITLIVLASLGAWLFNRRRASLVIAFSMISLAFAFVLTTIVTSFHPRYMLPYSLVLFVLIGGALAGFREGSQRRAIVAGLIMLIAGSLTINGWSVASELQYAKDDARDVAAYLRAHATSEDVILVESNDYTLVYYDHGPAVLVMIPAETEADALRDLSAAIGTRQHVWLAHWTVSTQDRRGYWRYLLAQSGNLIDWTSYRGYELTLYDMQSPLHAVRLGDHPALAFGSLATQRWSMGLLPDGNAIPVAIEWQRTRDAQTDVWTRASVGLTDVAGQRISGVDAALLSEQGQPSTQWPANQSSVNYYVLPIPPGTPPLTYTLSVRLYDSQGASSDQTLGDVHLPQRLDTADPYRTWSGYQWRQPPAQPVETGLTLEDYALGGSTTPLGTVDLTLRWRKTAPAAHAAPLVRLVQGDRVWAEAASQLIDQDYPIEQWVNGETVLDRRKLTYPAILSDTRLEVGHGSQWLMLASLSLDRTSLKFQPPSMPHAQSAVYGDLAELLGYDLEQTSVAMDRPLALTLYWRARNTDPLTTTYTAFTQLLAPDGHVVAQHDGPPDPPTPAWLPGEIVTDRHDLKVLDFTYRGPATLIVGWYNSATIQRVSVQTGGDFVTLQTPIQVNDK